MKRYLVLVSARPHGSAGVFENYEVRVQEKNEQDARRKAAQSMITRGYNTDGTSILSEG